VTFVRASSEGDLSEVDALAAKLGKLKALKVANVLHMNVKKVLTDPHTDAKFSRTPLILIVDIRCDVLLYHFAGLCSCRTSLPIAGSRQYWRRRERGTSTRYVSCGCGAS
jgi:hypothetical protein